MTTSTVTRFLVPLAATLVASAALAHGPGGGGACSGVKGQMKALCASGNPRTCLSTLCPDVPAGPGAWAQCLLNLNDGKESQKLSTPLTPACVTELNDRLAAIQKEQQAFTAACAADAATFCNNVTSGQRATMQCLHQAVKDNKAVSANCQTLLAQHHPFGPHPHGPGEFGHPPGKNQR